MKRPVKWRRWVAGVVGLAMLAVGVYLVASWKGWRIREIVCRTEFGECSQELGDFLQQFKGRNWVISDSRDIEGAVAGNFEVRVVVRKRWGGKIEVEVVRKQAVAGVWVSGEGGDKGGRKALYLVTLEGEVVEIAQASELPKVTLRWQVGISAGEKFTDSRVVNAVKIVAGLAQQGTRVDGEVKEESLWVNWPKGAVVIFPLDRDPGVLVAALQLMMSQARIEKGNLKKIDLRFKNPVLTVL